MTHTFPPLPSEFTFATKPYIAEDGAIIAIGETPQHIAFFKWIAFDGTWYPYGIHPKIK